MKTLKSKINIEGIGLMSGAQCSLVINPSSEKGIRFHNNNVSIEANLDNVVSTEHCVVLGNESMKVALVEHFMAACAICDIDGLDVEIKGFEMPILDGSSKIWVEEFLKAGIEGSDERKTCLSSPVIYTKGKSSVILIPSDEPTKISYMVNFNHPELKNRWVDSTNLDEITVARTFGYLKDLETFQKMGFSKGVTIENTVGLTEDGYTTELRNEFEPAKHKILDIIGDLYLTGVNPLKLNANIIVKEAGHALHVETAKLLREQL